MAKIGVYNLDEHYKGDTWDGATFTLTDQNDDPIDLTGVTIRMQFRESGKKGSVARDLNSDGNGIVISDATGGVIVIESFIMDFDAGTYFYDMQFTYPSGLVKTRVKGTIKVEQDTTY